MGLENKYNSSVAFGLSSVLPFPSSPTQFLLLFDFIFCGKRQKSALNLVVNFYEHLTEHSWLDPCAAEGWTVSTSTKPLLQLLMSHLTKAHCPETSAKVQGWHRESEQSKDVICKSSSLASSLVQTRAPACTDHPVSRLDLCFGYLSSFTTAGKLLHCAGKFPKDLIQRSGQGRGLGVLDQPWQCDLEIQENYLTVCCWFNLSVC